MRVQSPNKLLAVLPVADYERIFPDLRTIHLAGSDKLSQCGETRVYFPGSGVCSIRSVMEDGRLIEIAAVGKEGMVGLASLTGDVPANKSFVHVTDGFAQYMPLGAFRREVARGGALAGLVERYSRVFLESAMQLAACNRLHTLQERYCRWLLVTNDRVGRRQLELTPAFLAGALGARRQELAVITKTLQDLNVIEFEEGVLTIFDRQSIERFACDCYALMKRRHRAEPADPGERSETCHTGAMDSRLAPLHPIEVCGQCGVSTGTPHQTERDCLRALDAEIKLLIQRTRRLHTQRSKLVEQRLSSLRSFVGKNSRTS